MPLHLVVLVVAVSTGVLQIVGVITAALIAAAGTYMGLHRSTSGSIRTSDAATIWSASEKIRQHQENEIVDLRLRVETLEAENREQARKIRALEAELSRLKGVVE